METAPPQEELQGPKLGSAPSALTKASSSGVDVVGGLDASRFEPNQEIERLQGRVRSLSRSSIEAPPGGLAEENTPDFRLKLATVEIRSLLEASLRAFGSRLRLASSGQICNLCLGALEEGHVDHFPCRHLYCRDCEDAYRKERSSSLGSSRSPQEEKGEHKEERGRAVPTA